jgi:hypothetical protein
MHRRAAARQGGGRSRISGVNRVGLVVVLLGILFAGSAFFLLATRTPDDPGDGARPNSAAVRELPPRPDTASSRDTSEPPPRAPDAPRPPAPKRRSAPAAAAPVAETAAPPRETATLRIVSDVPDAQVFLNREFVGATPATAKDLPPGTYQLNVSATGYDNHVETIEVTPGERELSVRFREVRLNTSLAVVHKHRFGSCKGTLTATAQGVRYETADKNDAFEAPLLNLETFQVDYLAKNLRIQPRQGKRYDFTDPDGNADRLFVFHRDVERARERLKKGDTP